MHYFPGKPSKWYAEQITQIKALLKYPIHILGHPFRQLASAGPVPDEIIDETLRLAKQAGVAIEINAHVHFADDAKVLARAVKLDIPVAFSLDSHHYDELSNYDYFADVVQASGVSYDQIRFFRA
jgi:histidinol phosphatase-like PHP family hydrolase